MARRRGALERGLVLWGRMQVWHRGGVLWGPGDEVHWNGISCYVGGYGMDIMVVCW